VQVDDAVEGVVFLLQGDPVANGAEQVSDMRLARRLDAAEDPLPANCRCLVQGYS
jgi:hypothetical protein